MRHHTTARSPRPAFGARLVIALQILLLASLGFTVSSAVGAPLAVAEDGPCGANPCGTVPADQGPCGANPCGTVPADQGPCGANPCGAVPADQGPCGANPCATDVPADPNIGKPVPPDAKAPAAPATTAPAKAPVSGASTSTSIDTTGSRRDKAASVVVDKSGDGGLPAWVIPVGIVVLFGGLVLWLVRRQRVHEDPPV